MKLNRRKVLVVHRIAFIVIFLALFLFCFLTMDYMDGRINANIGYKLARGLFSGKFKEAYNSLWLSYGVTIYMIYMVWNAPIAIIDILADRVTDFDTCVGPMLWNKLLLVLFLVGCCVWVYKIALYFGKKEALFVMVFFLTSPLTLFPAVAITQCDVMTLFFGLAGIYFLIKQDDRWFILFFAIASTMKYMILFIFVPLLLLRYKKVKYWFAVGGIGGLFLLISEVATKLSKSAQSATADPSNYVQWHLDQFLSQSVVPLGMGSASLLIIYFLAICIIAYLQRPESMRMRVQWIMWICLAGWYTLFIFYGGNCYWYILMSPFLIFIVLNNEKYRDIGVFVSVLLANLYLLERVSIQPWVFGGKLTFTRLLLRNKVQESPDLLFTMINDLLRGNFQQIVPILISCIVAGSFTLLVLFLPRQETETHKCRSKALSRGCWGNLLSLILWIVLMLGEQLQFWK